MKLTEKSTNDIDRIVEGFSQEREDLGMSWAEYLCYVLEADKEELNQDGLVQIAAVVGYTVNTDTDRNGDFE